MVARDADDRNYIMVVDTCGHAGKQDSDTYPCGLPYSHAYSCIRVATNCAGSGINLVQIRNPHGTNEPQLPWKDNDPIWNQYPAIKAELAPEMKDDGSFWCTDADFFAHFNNVFVVRCSMETAKNGASGRKRR